MSGLASSPQIALRGTLPLDGGGLGGGEVSRRASRDLKKHPIDGARARARALGQNMTEAERRTWQNMALATGQGCKFCRQVPIGRYIADFVCHEARLIVELDGGQHGRSSPREAERSGILQNQATALCGFGKRGPGKSRRRPSEDRRRLGPPHHPHPTLPHQGGGRVDDISAHDRARRQRASRQKLCVYF